jgi:ferredoxin-NADP reductase/ferredoxin
MNCRIEITTRDGAQFDFACEPGQDVLTAAAAATITLPSQCRQGSCGACHATVSAGDYDLGVHSPDALPAGEPGATLLCRTVPRGDIRVSLPYDSTKVLFQPVSVRNTQITALETIAQNTVRVELAIDPNDPLGCAAEFEPGQFAELEIPGTGVRRPFSISNTSNWDGRLEFLIRLQPQGKFSAWLRDSAKPGDALTVHGPQGGFGLIAGSLRPRWFVAGGTGLAPVLSIVRRMAEYQEMDDARVFFGVSHEEELFMVEELRSLQAQLPQLKVELCVWRPRDDWSGFSGTPVDALTAALAQADVAPDIYVCGPPALVTGARNAAAAAHIPADQFVSERFTV